MYLLTITFRDGNLKPTILDYLSKNVEITMDFSAISFNLGLMQYISPLLNVGNITKPENLIPGFYLNNMLIRLNLPLMNGKLSNSFEDFNFISHCYLNPFYEIFFSLLSNRIFQIFLLTVTAYLMQKISTILCNGYITGIFNLVCKVGEGNTKQEKEFCIHPSIFFNLYNYIMGLTSLIYRYIYSISYSKLYYDILFFLYINVRSLIPNLGLTSNIKILSNYTYNVYVVFKLNIIMFSDVNLNVIYSTLTIIYVILGWLLDYLSYVWLLAGRSMSYSHVLSLSFWLKRFCYGVLYILWLYLGVISTNGVYLSILNNIGPIKGFNIIITVFGSILSYISSNLWYFYAKAILPQEFSIKDVIILPLLLSPIYGVSNSTSYVQLRGLLYHYLLSPIHFNLYSTFRRSIFEWLAFLGMVFSTYGSWNLYTMYVFPYLSVVQNLLIWIGPTIISGFSIIYLEEIRPRLGNLFYGLFYLSFWTSICFFTNTILLGYFDVNNAVNALLYFIPINFFLSFVYSVPLYRNTITLTVVNRLIHFLLLILLISITLVSAGLIWYIIGTV